MIDNSNCILIIDLFKQYGFLYLNEINLNYNVGVKISLLFKLIHSISELNAIPKNIFIKGIWNNETKVSMLHNEEEYSEI